MSLFSALTAYLIAGEPSTPWSVALFDVIYLGATIAIMSRIEGAMLLGEVLQRFPVFL